MNSDASQELTWFEKFDEVSLLGRPNDSERIILNMPFNQEQERVQRWTQVAATVAKRYRLTAKTLRTVQAPAGRADLDEYRTLRMEWFNDAADVYEEMIKPRKPAQNCDGEEKPVLINEIAYASSSISTTCSATVTAANYLGGPHQPSHWYTCCHL